MALKVTKELEKKYKNDCRNCIITYEKIHGVKSVNCAYKEFSNEYCEKIENKEKNQPFHG